MLGSLHLHANAEVDKNKKHNTINRAAFMMESARQEL